MCCAGELRRAGKDCQFASVLHYASSFLLRWLCNLDRFLTATRDDPVDDVSLSELTSQLESEAELRISVCGAYLGQQRTHALHCHGLFPENNFSA